MLPAGLAAWKGVSVRTAASEIWQEATLLTSATETVVLQSNSDLRDKVIAW